ncbi:hypothetical protein ILUMI_10214 [Ignelater luminosus]|uniref:Uncharacterized protein n=1 Tax=Ignelater luminosus TaxID=2038154 RepID=A0A8K0GEC3_IGNLU|nr:hypothetical protein ILUMI_10214 [Ignelater luminosus]
MKCLIVCFVVLVGALAFDWDSDELKCVEELGTDKATIERIGDRKPMPIDNQKFNEFTECSWKKQGLIKKDGTINWDEIHEVILGGVEEKQGRNKNKQAAENAARRLVNPCRNITGTTRGQTAVKIHNCLDNQLRNYRP